MFAHFLITQFNLLKFPKGIENFNEWICWTRRRIEIFERFCLPSVLSQKTKNFVWLIYFDSQTPSEFDYFVEHLNSFHFVMTKFADGFDDFMSQYMLDVKALSLNKSWIMTSRLDNDDCLEESAILAIQENFKPLDEYLISLGSGYTLDLSTLKLSHYYYPMSPFITLVENANKDKLKGIYYIPHSGWRNLHLNFVNAFTGMNNVCFLFQKPFWIQVVHGENVSNSMRRGVPIFKSKSLLNFGIEINSSPQSAHEIIKYFSFYIWKLYVLSIIHRILINIRSRYVNI